MSLARIYLPLPALKNKNKKTKQNGVDDSGFIHLLLQPHQSCDRNMVKQQAESPGA